MGGIPLVALAGRQPQIQSPTDVANAAVNLSRNRTAEQSEQLDVQQKQQALQDQKTIMQTLAANKGDIEASLPQLAGKITPQAYTGLAKWNLDQRKTHAEIDDKELTVKKDRLDRLTALHQQALQIPDEQYAQQWPMIAAAANQIDPKLNLNPQQPIPKDQLEGHGIGLMVEDQYLKQEQDKRAAAKSEQELQENKTKMTAVELSLAGQALGAAKSQEDWDKGRALLKQRITGNAFAQIPEQYSPQAVEQVKQQGISPEKAAAVPVDRLEMADWLKKNPGKGPADYMKYKATLIPQFNFNLQGGAGGAPKVDDPLVQAVANAKMKIGDVLTPRTPLPVRKQFLAAVMQANPNFDSKSYDVEKGVEKAFTSGKEAQNLTAFNTAIEHSKQLDAAVDALGNIDERTLNKVGNALSVELGSDKVGNFNVIKNALSGEISKVFKGGQATDAEIHAVQGPFDAANSPKQLKGAIKNAIALMNSKRDALKQQYEAGKQGKPNFGEGEGEKKSFFSQFGGGTKQP